MAYSRVQISGPNAQAEYDRLVKERGGDASNIFITGTEGPVQPANAPIAAVGSEQYRANLRAPVDAPSDQMGQQPQIYSRFAPPPAPAPSPQEDEKKRIEQEANALQVQQPEFKTRGTTADLFKGLGEFIKPAPASKDTAAEFKALRATEGADAVQNEYNTARADLRDIENQILSEQEKMKAQPGVSSRYIGRQLVKLSEDRAQGLRAAEARVRDAADMLNSKNELISQIMTFKQQDYRNSVDEYNSQFSQTLQLATFMGTQRNVISDNARANATMVMNLFKDKEFDPSQITDEQRTAWNQWELQMNAPKGTIETALIARPKKELKTVGEDNNGNPYLVYSDGSIVRPVGAIGGPTTSYKAEIATTGRQAVFDLLTIAQSNPGIFGRTAATPWPDALRSNAFRNYKAGLDYLKGNIIPAALTAMREASKTGGALGQVSDREGAWLGASLGALDMSQSPDMVIKQLKAIDVHLKTWQTAVEQSGSSSGFTITAPDGTEVQIID